jgi:hypothetical protein
VKGPTLMHRLLDERRWRDRVMHNQIDDAFNHTEHGAGIRKRLRREPTLRKFSAHGANARTGGF